MSAAHRTPAPPCSPCPVGTSCGGDGSEEVGSVKGPAEAGRCRKLCAVRGGLCARCCVVLSAWAAKGDDIDDLGQAPASLTQPFLRPPIREVSPLGPRGQPKASGRASGAVGCRAAESQATRTVLDASGVARLLRTALRWSTLPALSRQPASPSRARRGALPSERPLASCVAEASPMGLLLSPSSRCACMEVCVEVSVWGGGGGVDRSAPGGANRGPMRRRARAARPGCWRVLEGDGRCWKVLEGVGRWASLKL